MPGLGGRSIYWAQGRLVGGSSSINGMMYVRGPARDYDGWNLDGWRYRDVLPLFRRSETNERGASDIHGGDGPLRVSAGRSTAPVCDLFLEAVQQAGYPLTDDLNRAMRVGRAIESGIVGINAGLISNAANPFGGVKQSGYGREGSVYGVADYMQVKALTLALR